MNNGFLSLSQPCLKSDYDSDNHKFLLTPVPCDSYESSPPKQPFYLDLLLNESDPSVSKVVQQVGFVVIREVSTYTN